MSPAPSAICSVMERTSSIDALVSSVAAAFSSAELDKRSMDSVTFSQLSLIDLLTWLKFSISEL